MTDDDGSADESVPDVEEAQSGGARSAEQNQDAESPASERSVDDPPSVDRSVHADAAADDSRTNGQPDREELLTERRSIDDRIRWKWTLRVVLVAAVIGSIAGAIGVVVFEWGVLPGVGAFGAFLGLGIGYVLLLYRTWRYEVRSDALYLERGVFTHVKTVVPFVRVQHIDTSRDPIDRAIGLSSLVVYTAGSRGADVTIPGLTSAQAADMQDRLKLLAKESTGDDAV